VTDRLRKWLDEAHRHPWDFGGVAAAALRAVVELHRPTGEANPTNQDVCRNCSWAWPCPTIREVEKALGLDCPCHRAGGVR
jgi:hypothetical protein